jgi:hypothetical protein
MVTGAYDKSRLEREFDGANVSFLGTNNAPSKEEIVNSLAKFRVSDLRLSNDGILIKFTNHLFTLADMVTFAHEFNADEIDIIDNGYLRLWWD